MSNARAKCCGKAILLALALLGGTAEAQTAASPPLPAPQSSTATPVSPPAAVSIAAPLAAPLAAKTASDPCPQDSLFASPIGARLRELALRPGVKIEPAAFFKDPETAAYIGQMTRQTQDATKRDFAGLCRYRAANAARPAGPAPSVVFLGDSITDNWIYGDPSFFSDRVIDRGISGQTSAQILLRFYADVVALHPAVVHILAGTNDVLQDLPANTDDDIINNFNAMMDLAKVHHIKVVIASILPISVRPWQPALAPASRVARLNQRLKDLASLRGATFVDYHRALVDGAGGLRAEFGNDGVHPNRAGYAVMRALASRATGLEPR